jgi:mono/diheme cytochrome c family protein
MSAATAGAAVLAVLGAGMVALAVASGGGEEPSPRRAAATPAPSLTAARDDGRAVWVAQGCGSCHALEAAGASGVLGPDLGEVLRGMPRAAIRRSIVVPAAGGSPGYGTGAMPEDYASRMSERELDRLVAFLDRAAG